MRITEREFGAKKEVDPQATQLWLMRHGPTRWNLDHRIQGNVDTELVPEELIPYFERVGVSTLPQPSRLIVTEFKRSRKTAEGLIDYLGWPADLPIVTVPALNERIWGDFEGKQQQQVVAELKKHPEIVAAYPDLDTRTDFSPILDAPYFTIAGAESMNQVGERTEPAVLSFRELYPGEILVGVVHAGVLISLGLNPHEIHHIEVRVEHGTPVLVKIPSE